MNWLLGGGGAPVAFAAPAAGGADAAAAAPAAEEKKVNVFSWIFFLSLFFFPCLSFGFWSAMVFLQEEPKEESDEDMGFSLFD